MYMGSNPCALFLIDESFDVRILAVRHDTHKEECRNDLTGIRIRNPGRIASPVDFNLFTGFPVDVHGCAAFLLILLDVAAELGIHERFIAGLAAFLQIFRPEEFFVDTISEQSLLDVVKIRHLLLSRYRCFPGKHKFLRKRQIARLD